MSKVRSLLKYPGGKFALLDVIEQHLPKEKFDLYGEVFLGGASVALNLGLKIAPLMALNDANSDVMDFWFAAKHFPDQLYKLIEELSHKRSQEEYLGMRHVFNTPDIKQTMTPEGLAALFYYLNREGFNGLIRYNSKGKWNVPYGKMKSFKLPEQMTAVSSILQNSALFRDDWSVFIGNLINQHNNGESVFMYLDPPYIPLSKTASFTSYWKGFCNADHEALRLSLDWATKAGIKFMLSNSKTSDTERIFKGYNFIEVQAPRNISCKGTGRGSISEYLITNY